MMVHDRSDDAGRRRFPSAEVVQTLRGALAQYLEGKSPEERVCEALALVAAEAQERRLHAEDMLVAFRRIWSDLPQVEAISDPAERRHILGRLVKICIDEFYRE